jgi:hypothetical protein
MDTTDEAPTLAEILRDLTYPAEKWQITTCAEIYGADVRTRRELYGLPARTYRTAAEITDILR